MVSAGTPDESDWREETLMEVLAELNPDAMAADGFEDAAIGYTLNPFHRHVLVYDADHCLEILEQDGMSPEEAVEWFEYNTLGAYVGPDGPLFVRVL